MMKCMSLFERSKVANNETFVGYWLSLAFYKGAGRTTLRFHWSYEQRCFIGILKRLVYANMEGRWILPLRNSRLTDVQCK